VWATSVTVVPGQTIVRSADVPSGTGAPGAPTASANSSARSDAGINSATNASSVPGDDTLRTGRTPLNPPSFDPLHPELLQSVQLPFHYALSEHMTIMDEWLHDQDPFAPGWQPDDSADVGLIRLNWNIGARTGTLAFSTEQFPTVFVAGYGNNSHLGLDGLLLVSV